MKKLLQSLFLFIFIAAQAIAQDRTVTGTVTAKEDGLPLPGVSVTIPGTQTGTQTSAAGKFSLRVPAANTTLRFTYIGYETQTLTIGENGVVNVVLSQTTGTLDEVVVTAGGVNIQRREQGNQSTTIRAQELTQGKAFNVASGLSGKVAGLQVNAVSSGVNPNIRLVLRGNRSLLGNNQALVVVDNIIVPTSILGNLNPEDIEDIQVLNGAGAAALYGSDASNGALIITTKKGKSGISTIVASNTTSLEQVSFLPQLQKTFGSGTSPDDVPTYTAYENQQYGPAFDGSMREIGKPLQDGSIQTIQYSPVDDKDDFWEMGLTNQTDLSISSGDDKSTYYIAGQYLEQEATVPGDQYNRFSLRVNGTREVAKSVDMSFSANYVQNRFDVSSATGAAFGDLLQSPSQIPVRRYKDWRNDPFANPNGYYNEYFNNPYYTLDNNRSSVRNDYLTGNAEIKFNPIEPLTFTFRVGVSTRNFSSKNTSNLFTYSDYTKSISGSSKTDDAGAVVDGSGYLTQINSDFLTQYIKQLSPDFSFNAILGASLRQNNAKYVNISANGLVIDGLFNVDNRLIPPTATESNFLARQLGVFGDVRLGFKEYLYLHVTGRNDWRSILAPDNRSFFYPAADLSFIASDAIPFLAESNVIQTLKLRGGISQVGQVSLGNFGDFGAYYLLPTFGQGAGYPYTSGPGFGLGNQTVSPDINPEITSGFEGGFDLNLFNGDRVTSSFTYYESKTVDQTIPIQISSATGFTTFLTNTGEVSNKGIETALRITPYRTSDWDISVGGNYTYNKNEVLSLDQDLEELNLFGSGSSNIVARRGEPFPLLKGTDYNRDPQGRIIVDPVTGYPSVSQNPIVLGNTDPIHRLGLDAVVTYKGLRLSTLFEYRTGYILYNNVTTGFDFSGSGIRTTYFNRERFVVPNSSYEDPANPGTYIANNNITVRNGGADFWTDGPRNTGVSSNYAISGAFWKLREISLSYDLPKSLLGNLKYVKGATISLQGRNLFLFTPKSNIYTDPEYSAAGSESNAIGVTTLGQTPPSRFFGATASLTF